MGNYANETIHNSPSIIDILISRELPSRAPAKKLFKSSEAEIIVKSYLNKNEQHREKTRLQDLDQFRPIVAVMQFGVGIRKPKVYNFTFLLVL